MKYLAALKSEISLPDEKEEQKKRHHNELQKVQKDVFTVFAVQEGSTLFKKKAQGYGCAACGKKTYQAIPAWETKALPQISSWTHEHQPIVAWKCENCGSVYEIIGGSKGPEYIN